MDITIKEYINEPTPDICFGLPKRDPNFKYKLNCDVKFIKSESIENNNKIKKKSEDFSMDFSLNMNLKNKKSNNFTFELEKVTLKFMNIPYNIMSNDLYKRIITIAKPFDCFIVMKDGESRGYGFVHFSSMKEALKAKEAFDGKPIGKNIIDVIII